MYCGLKDPGWILVQLSQNSSEQQNVHFLTSMPPLELSVLDFFLLRFQFHTGGAFMS